MIKKWLRNWLGIEYLNTQVKQIDKDIIHIMEKQLQIQEEYPLGKDMMAYIQRIPYKSDLYEVVSNKHSLTDVEGREAKQGDILKKIGRDKFVIITEQYYKK